MVYFCPEEYLRIRGFANSLQEKEVLGGCHSTVIVINDPPDLRREGRQGFMLLFFCEHQTFFVKPQTLCASAILYLYLCKHCYIIVKAAVFFTGFGQPEMIKGFR